MPKRATLVPRSDRSATSSLGAFSRSEDLSCGHLPSSLAYPQCPCTLECDYTKQRAAQIDSKAAWRRCAPPRTPPCTCVDVHLRQHSLSVWWAHWTPQRSRVLRTTSRKVDRAQAQETRGALAAARHMPDASIWAICMAWQYPDCFVCALTNLRTAGAWNLPYLSHASASGTLPHQPGPRPHCLVSPFLLFPSH